MRRSLKYIAGASALALAAVGIAELRGSRLQPEGETATEAARDAPAAPAGLVADAAPVTPPASQPVPQAGSAAVPQVSPEEVAARIDDLTSRLSARETELAALNARLAERDATLDTMTATLTAREAEIQSLRDEIASLRDRYAFDIQLEAMKGRGTAPDAGGDATAVLAATEPATEPAAAPAIEDILNLTSIQFESGSSRLTPGGQVHAAAAAVMLSERAVVRVRLLGYADRVGNADRNRALAEARAKAVADFLVRSGVAAQILDVAGMGEDDLPVATGDGVSEPLNRSVAIVAIPRPTT